MNIIREARERHSLSQIALAELVGCSQKHISSLELGQKSPSPQIAKKLADSLGIDVLDILYPNQN